MNKDTLINKVSEALYCGSGAIFVGSGISVKSTKVDWFKLIKPLSDELGIMIDNDHDDLTIIAQYIVNNHTGNRGPLISSISKAFNKNFPLNNYHKALSFTNVSTIWTTNYDTLLEQAFSKFLVDVKVNDDSISRNVINPEIEIIKIHGCISRSHHNEIIITQEDYEDFLENKPAISQRLQNDLLNKSFLFIGYSYRDPNIRNIMLAARRLSKKTTQQHFLIMIKPKENDQNILKEKEKRLELWCKDLKRLGISTLIIENYDELEEILFAISQKSRGNTVYVTGSHERSRTEAHQLGRLLARDADISLISGQSSGIGSDVVSAFMEECIDKKYDINNRIQIFPNPYAANPSFSNDKALLPELKNYRARLMSSTQVVVVYSGGMGTEAEIEVARNMNCKLIPVVHSKENLDDMVIRKLLEDPLTMERLKATDVEYYNKLLEGNISAEDVMSCVKKMLA